VAIQQQEAQHKKRQSALRIKIISMGAPGVGKSCLIKRYCEEKFVSKYVGTIGVDDGVKCVRLGSCDVRVNLWDLAGGEEYFEVRNEFYKEAQGCILVYDVNNRASFQARQLTQPRRARTLRAGGRTGGS
jgi:DnaJ family protein C protein 27